MDFYLMGSSCYYKGTGAEKTVDADIFGSFEQILCILNLFRHFTFKQQHGSLHKALIRMKASIVFLTALSCWLGSHCSVSCG